MIKAGLLSLLLFFIVSLPQGANASNPAQVTPQGTILWQKKAPVALKIEDETGAGIRLAPFEYFIRQGDGSISQSFNCGPATVAMALRYASGGIYSLSPQQIRNSYMRRGSIPIPTDEFTDIADIEQALKRLGATTRQLTSVDAIWQAVERYHPVIVPVRMRDISLGQDIFQPASGSCRGKGQVYLAGSSVVCEGGVAIPATGKHVDFAFGEGVWDGHIVLINGTYTAKDGTRYFYLYDPNIFGRIGSAYFYFGDRAYPKGQYRLWRVDEVAIGLRNNGGVAIEVAHNPANPIAALAPTGLTQTQIATGSMPSAQFALLGDVSLLSGSIVQPGELLLKQWRIRNSGRTHFGLYYRLVQAEGPPVQLYGDASVGQILRGKEAVISAYLQAPSSPGVYSTTWQIVDAADQPITGTLPFEFVVAEQPGSRLRIDDARLLGLPETLTVAPGQTLRKRWRVRNLGSLTWGEGYEVVLVEGDAMGAAPAVALPETEAGSATEIELNLIAPGKAGIYRATWRLRNPAGELFGDALEVKLTVRAPGVGH